MEMIIQNLKSIYAMFVQAVCGPLWDNASCIPPTLASTAAVFPCMETYNGRRYPACGESVLKNVKIEEKNLASVVYLIR